VNTEEVDVLEALAAAVLSPPNHTQTSVQPAPSIYIWRRDRLARPNYMLDFNAWPEQTDRFNAEFCWKVHAFGIQ
jgi:hypothetical protein